MYRPTLLRIILLLQGLMILIPDLFSQGKTYNWTTTGNQLSANHFLGSSNNTDIIFKTNNREHMRLTALGNLGIGNAKPGEKLSVAGTVESTTGGFRFPDGSLQKTAVDLSSGGPAKFGHLHVTQAIEVGNSIWLSGVQQPGGSNSIYTDDADLWINTVGGKYKFNTILNGYEADANVGIGTLTPKTKLDLAVSTVDGFRITGPYHQVIGGSNTNILLEVRRKEPTLPQPTFHPTFIIRQNGNVGIGTENPLVSLDINGKFRLNDGSQQAGYIMVANANGVGSWQAPNLFPGWQSAGNHLYNTNAGNVGIGTNNPFTTLDINGTFRLNDGNQQADYIMVTDASGIGKWQDPGTVTGWQQTGNHMYNTNSGKVGIGTSTMDAKLDVDGSVDFNGNNFFLQKTGDGMKISKKKNFFGNNKEAFVFEKRDDNQTRPDGGIAFANSGSGGVMDNIAMVIRGDGKIGMGVKNPKNKLDVCGTIRSTEVIVETNWCDYVFEEDYALRPLDEVSAFVQANKHLPGIPPAVEVESEGLKIADMNTRMMEKIEELTLYVIRLHEENKAIKAELDQLKEGSNQ